VYKDPKAIWDVDELEENIDIDDDVDDGRERPKYEFLYRQAVGTEDAYLGSNDKDPSSTCCEGMILRVELPGTPSMADIDLDVQVRLRDRAGRWNTARSSSLVCTHGSIQ